MRTGLRILTLALFVCACGSDDPSNGASSGTTTPPPGGGDGTKPPGSDGGGIGLPPAPSCTGKDKLAGNLDWTITSGGRDRVAHVHVPPSYDPSKGVPVVLNFHGLGSNGGQQALYAEMPAKSDAAGFVAVHAEGVGNSWNAGVCCGTAQSGGVDDVAFVRALLDELEARLCVDEKRVFSTGMSNGGFLSYRLACELSDRIAAIAPVAGGMAVTSCSPARPVPILHFHGTMDNVVPYAGNPGLAFAPVQDSIDGWIARDECTGPAKETLATGDTKCLTHDACGAGSEVTLCTVTGGGHTWPGAIAIPSLGPTTQAIDATDMIWDFFLKHPMP